MYKQTLYSFRHGYFKSQEADSPLHTFVLLVDAVQGSTIVATFLK